MNNKLRKYNCLGWIFVFSVFVNSANACPSVNWDPDNTSDGNSTGVIVDNGVVIDVTLNTTPFFINTGSTFSTDWITSPTTDEVASVASVIQEGGIVGVNTTGATSTLSFSVSGAPFAVTNPTLFFNFVNPVASSYTFSSGNGSFGSIQLADSNLNSFNITGNVVNFTGISNTVDSGFAIRLIGSYSTIIFNGLSSIAESHGFTVSLNMPEMSVEKTADNTVNMPAGSSINYTYVVKNDGCVTLSNITLADLHNGFGAPPIPSNETLSLDNNPLGDSTDSVADNGIWDTLAAGDEITFIGNYIVTQADVDNLQ